MGFDKMSKDEYNEFVEKLRSYKSKKDAGVSLKTQEHSHKPPAK